MRIKKTSQYIEGGASLSTVYGTSNTDGYTQSYINGMANAITICLSSNQSATISSSYGAQNINFDKIYFSTGNKLTFDSTNHCIVIGSGVHHIEINASTVIANGNNNTSDRYLYCYKDTTNVGQTYYLNAVPTNQHYPLCITPFITEVAEGDKIYIKISSGQAETISVKGASTPRTYLTVKVID